MSTAEYQREWRRRHGQGRPPGRPAVYPCGTWQAARRHQRNGEAMCGPCREAYNAKQREYYAARKSTG